MADKIRVDHAKGIEASAELKRLAQDAQDYIDGELTRTISDFGSWWEGDAFNKFKSDFELTKSKFRQEIYDEIIAYANNLETAVKAQQQQDTANSNAIGIN